MSEDLFLRSTDPRRQAAAVHRLAAAGTLALLLDGGCALSLQLSLHGWSLRRAVDGGALGAFGSDAADLALLAALRLLVLPCLTALAVRVARRRGEGGGSAPAASSALAAADPLCEPLLPVTAGGAALAAPRTAAQRLREEHAADGALLRRRDAALAALFAACTACSVFAGVKCSGFAFGSGGAAPALRTLRASLLAATAMLSVVENVVLTRCALAATARPGVLRAALHPHALFYSNDRSIVAHSCDCCRRRVTEGFRCPVCDFDCCLDCFVRPELASAEGGLRTDRGLVGAPPGGGPPPSSFFLRALRLVRPEAPLFALAFACLLATTVATLALPNFQGHILDTVWQGDAPAFRRDVALLVLYSLASGLFGGLKSLCFNLVGRRLAFEVRNALLRSILAADVAFFDAAATGDLTSRLAYDVSNMLQPLQSLLSSVVENAALLVGAVAACCLQSWQLTLLAATTLLPATYVTQLYAAWSSTLNRHISAALGEGSAAATEALANIRTVRTLSTEQEEAAKYAERTRRALACGVRDACGGSLAYALNNYLDLGTTVLILWFGGGLALRNHAAGVEGGLTAGKLVTFTLFWNMFNGSFRSLQSTVASFTRAAGSAQRVLSLIDMAPSIPKSGGLAPASPLRGDVSFEAVEFTYQMRPNQKVLRGVDLAIPAGTVCALVGRSGGGKSTLVHLLLRLYDPTAGRITLDGVDLRDLDLTWVHRQTGCVAQDTQLFADSVAYNIAYGCPPGPDGRPPTQDEIEAAAGAAHAHGFVSAFAEGYSTRCGERGVRLSGGQKQRIAIARALLRRPRLLLLDEATSALDAESEALVQAALDGLVAAGGRTVLLVAHRLSTVVGADQICVVDGGAVAERGTHVRLVAAGGVYARLVARQMAARANALGGEGAGAGGGAGGDVVDSLAAAAG